MKKKAKTALLALLCFAVAMSAGGFFVYLIRGDLSGQTLSDEFTAGLQTVDASFSSQADVRIMSSNLLVNYKSWGGSPAKPRAQMYMALVDAYRPDVIGIQEMCDSWYCLLRRNLPDGYKMVYPVSSGVFVRMTALVYNSNTLTLLDNGQMVYTQATNPRVRRAVWALFEVQKTGKRFIAVSTHLDFLHENITDAELPVMQSEAQELVQLVQDLAKKHVCPVFVTGDFNAKEPSKQTREVDAPAVYTYLSEALTDAKREADQTVCGNGADLSKPTYDHIFFYSTQSRVRVLKYAFLSEKVFKEMSDHYPIFIDAQLS